MKFNLSQRKGDTRETSAPAGAIKLNRLFGRGLRQPPSQIAREVIKARNLADGALKPFMKEGQMKIALGG